MRKKLKVEKTEEKEKSPLEIFAEENNLDFDLVK